MKLYSLLTTALVGVFLIVGCDKDRSQEEKIRITIEKEQKSQEPVSKPVIPPEKAVKEPPSRPEAAERYKKPEQLPKSEVKEPPITPEKLSKLAPGDKMDFKTVSENLDLDKHSKYEIKEYWQSLRGKTVIWTGKVYSVKKGRRGFKMFVNNPVVKSREGYNIILVSKEMQSIENISTGQTIRFSGTLADFDPGKAGSSAVIVLLNSKIFN